MKHIACSRLWTDLTIRGHLKQMTQCCKREPYDVPSDLIQQYGSKLFNEHPAIMDERKMMIDNNSLTKGCNSCIRSWPNSTWHSWNKWRDKDWSTEELDDLKTANLVEKIEISLSNKCNFSCMYCDHNFSSSWAKLVNKEVKTADSDWIDNVLDSLVDMLDPNIDYTFGFTGGEPLLDLETNTKIEKLLEKVNFHSNKEISIITSLGVKKKTLINFLELTKKYSNIKWKIGVSLDSTHNKGTIIRDGLNFDTFFDNLNTIVEYNTVDKLTFMNTISLLNISTMPETARWYMDTKNSIENKSNIFVNVRGSVVDYPFAMSTGLLTEDYRKYIDNCLDITQGNFDDFETKLGVVKKKIGTERSEQNLKNARNWFIAQGKIKSKNYFELFPELNQILG